MHLLSCISALSSGMITRREILFGWLQIRDWYQGAVFEYARGSENVRILVVNRNENIIYRLSRLVINASLPLKFRS
jgi:hypothetical protein